jgi:nucleoside-diphosphate-sugar epimerase
MAYYLIVGAAGYVGSRLTEQLLAHGHRVRGLVTDPDSPVVERLAAKGMAVWTGDITQPDTLIGLTDGPEYVLNVTSRLVIENGSLRRTFVDGNQNLIAACSRSRTVQRYLFTSSVAPYGSNGDAWVDEDTPVAPSYPLGQILAEAEQTIIRAIQTHHFPALLLRVATIYGPERDLIAPIEDGTTTIYGDGRNFTAHIHIDDLLEILERLPVEGQPGAIYNIGDDEPVRLIDLVDTVRSRLGMVPPRTFSPAIALQAGLDPSVIGMSTASVRLSNARLIHDLALTLRYPSVLDWIDLRLPLEQAVGV